MLLLALSCMPVFQAAHMLTHVTSDAIEGIVQVGGHLDTEAETDTESDIDKICLDCLALTAFSAVLPVLLICLFDQMRHHPPLRWSSRRRLLDFSFAYLSRAPPQA